MALFSSLYDLFANSTDNKTKLQEIINKNDFELLVDFFKNTNNNIFEDMLETKEYEIIKGIFKLLNKNSTPTQQSTILRKYFEKFIHEEDSSTSKILRNLGFQPSWHITSKKTFLDLAIVAQNYDIISSFLDDINQQTSENLLKSIKENLFIFAKLNAEELKQYNSLLQKDKDLIYTLAKHFILEENIAKLSSIPLELLDDKLQQSLLKYTVLLPELTKKHNFIDKIKSFGVDDQKTDQYGISASEYLTNYSITRQNTLKKKSYSESSIYTDSAIKVLDSLDYWLKKEFSSIFTLGFIIVINREYFKPVNNQIDAKSYPKVAKILLKTFVTIPMLYTKKYILEIPSMIKYYFFNSQNEKVIDNSYMKDVENILSENPNYYLSSVKCPKGHIQIEDITNDKDVYYICQKNYTTWHNNLPNSYWELDEI